MILPNGYTILDYIQSTGAQYIDTKFRPKRDTRIVLDVEGFGSAKQWLYGSVSYNDDFYFGRVTNNGTYVRVCYFGGFKNVTNHSSSVTSSRLVYDQSGGTMTVGSTSVTATAASASKYTESIYTLFLFNLNDDGVATSYGASVKLYSCQIYDSGTLIRDFVPCINPDGVVGLYDNVHLKFYTTPVDAFTAGSIVAPTEAPAPVYKLADGDQLDRALARTAFVIRDRSTITSPIQWDDEFGFADVLSSFSQVAFGAFTPTSVDVFTNPITVSGIPFTPRGVIAYSTMTTSFGSIYNVLHFFEIGDRTVVRYHYGGGAKDGSSIFSISLNGDGFTISALSATDSDSRENRISTAAWNYIAIG